MIQPGSHCWEAGGRAGNDKNSLMGKLSTQKELSVKKKSPVLPQHQCAYQETHLCSLPGQRLRLIRHGQQDFKTKNASDFMTSLKRNRWP
jgi:hypothetical protein